MDEDFSFYLDAARFAQRGICRSQTAAIATQQQAKQPAKKDKLPKPLPAAIDKGSKDDGQP